MEHRELRQLISARALDALDREDTALVDEHVESCAECARELDEMREVASALAFSAPPAEPPADLLDRILAETEAPAAAAAIPVARRGRLWRRRPAPWRGLALGFGGAATGLAVLAVVLASQLGNVRDQRDRVLAQGQRDAVALAAVAGPEAKLFNVPSTSRFAGSFVRSRAGAVLVIPSLSRLPQGKTYEAWLFDSSGKPVPAGTFQARGPTTVTPIDGDVQNATAVAVTVERSGGVAAPTGTPILQAKLA